MHNNAEFLNAYEIDKREVRFHLRKRAVNLAKKITNRLTEHSSYKNVGSYEYNRDADF